MNFDTKKGKSNISSSSLIALKAELLNKQSQAKQALSDGSRVIKRLKTPKPELKQNKGVSSRAQQDERDKEDDHGPTLEKSKLALLEKAKLYEKLSKDKNLLEEDTISEEQSFFLVNFQRKVVENTIQERRSGKSRNEEVDDTPVADEKEYEASNSDEEWVDYLDSFGRTRRCVKKDLPSYKQQDEQLKAQSYTNFVKSEAEEKTDQSQPPNASLESKSNYDAMQERRKMWEQEEEVSMQKSKLHYQDILYQEARQHGVGFYKFSKDEEERARQMQELEKSRRQTESARAQTAQTSSLKQTALNQRLMKVRQRKRQKLGLPPLDEKAFLAAAEEKAEKENPISEIKEEVIERSVIARPLPQSVKIRPWDLGKEGVPKKPVLSQSTWVEKKREERMPEFAPPSYLRGKSTPTERERPDVHNPVISEDSIAAGLAFMKQQQQPVDQELETDSGDENLLPPGESADAAEYSKMQPRRAEIPPPNC